MSWYDECDNPKVIHGYYSAPPALDCLELHEVVLRDDVPLLRLRADLPVFPDQPSKRWPPGSNTAQITISLWGASAVSIQDWSTDIKGVFKLERLAPQRLCFSFASNRVALRGECFAARIDGVTGYIKGAP